jgi:hypothetical protein
MADVMGASSLSSLLRCGEAYRRKELEREGFPPTTAQLRGSAVHRAIALGLIMQRRQEQPAPIDLYEDVAATQIERARQDGATFTPEERAAGPDQTWSDLTDRAVQYAGTYGRMVAPSIRPLHIEHRVVVADVVPGALLRGTVDLIEQGDGGAERLVDAKTSERRPHEEAADRSLQLTMYDLLRTFERREEADSTAAHPVALDVLARSRATGLVQHHRVTGRRDARDRQAMLRRIGMAVKAVRAGIFLAADPTTDWWCSTRYCEYAVDCPYFIGRRVPEAEE